MGDSWPTRQVRGVHRVSTRTVEVGRQPQCSLEASSSDSSHQPCHPGASPPPETPSGTPSSTGWGPPFPGAGRRPRLPPGEGHGGRKRPHSGLAARRSSGDTHGGHRWVLQPDGPEHRVAPTELRGSQGTSSYGRGGGGPWHGCRGLPRPRGHTVFLSGFHLRVAFSKPCRGDMGTGNWEACVP